MTGRITAVPVGVRARAVAWNLASLRRIPAHIITEEARAILLERAEHGAELRAWCEWRPPFDRGVWRLYDDATGKTETLGTERV